MCYVAGLGKISRIRFTIANLIGRGIACLATSAAGAFGGQIPMQGWMILIAVFIFAGIIWMVIKNRSFRFLIA
jgi:uncharacterized membrane protein YdjX (TVP38/TMEM64 family)